MDPQPPTSTLFPAAVQSRCGGQNYGGCGYRKRQCRGPIRLLVALVIRKVQEKRERESLAASLREREEGEQQERGVIEAMGEKRIDARGVKKEEKGEDVKVLTKSVRSMSL